MKYDINNDQLYSFLEASGFYTIATTSKAEGFTFCRIRDNVVTLIDKEPSKAVTDIYDTALEQVKASEENKD